MERSKECLFIYHYYNLVPPITVAERPSSSYQTLRLWVLISLELRIPVCIYSMNRCPVLIAVDSGLSMS
jgi:hypothetical protein